MLATIIRHELRDIIRDGRFHWTAAIVLGLLAAALATGWSYRQAVAAQHDAASRVTRETWLAQPAKDPHTAAHYGAYAFKPRGVLTLFDSGVNAYAGVAAWLEAHKQNEFQFRPAQDRASMARLGHLTAAITLQHLLPIVIILLAFTKFAGEREDGTLRQLAASGASLRLLAAGKAGGVAAALAVLLVPATVVGVVAVLFSSGTDGADVIARSIALCAVYAAYFATWVFVSLAVSARTARASHALGILLVLWAVNAVIAPRVAADLSRRWYPSPTAFEVSQAVQHESYDGLPVHTYNVRRAAGLTARLLSEHGVSRVEDLPVNFRGIDYLEREEHSDAVWDQQFGRVWESFAQQSRVHQWAGLVAPMLSVRALSSALAGADFFHHQHFAAEAERYRRRLVRTMNQRLAYGGSSQRLGAYSADPGFWSSVEPFSYRQPPMAWTLSQVRPAAIGLAMWLAVAGVALIVSVRRIAVE
jgi:ABC-2 type transport system permease protein